MTVEKYGKRALLAKVGEALLQYNLVLHMVLDSLSIWGSVSEHTLGKEALSGFGCIVEGLGSSYDWACFDLGSAAVNSGFAMDVAMLSVPFCLFCYLGQAEDQSPDSGELPGRKMGVSMVTADLGLVSMIRQGILALQLLPSNSSAGQ